MIINKKILELIYNYPNDFDLGLEYRKLYDNNHILCKLYPNDRDLGYFVRWKLHAQKKIFSSWDFRILKKDDTKVELVEVYYDNNKKPVNYRSVSWDFVNDTLEESINEYSLLGLAYQKEILSEVDFFPAINGLENNIDAPKQIKNN